MRIKCPRCGLVNKPGIAKCQSCGDDLTSLIELSEEETPSEDPLSLDNIKENRRKRKKTSPTADHGLSNGIQTELGWKDELERRVSEIKAERSRKISGKRRKDSDFVSEDDAGPRPSRHRAKGYDKYDEPDLFEKEEPDFNEEEEDSPDYDESQVFDDGHLEEYDREARFDEENGDTDVEEDSDTEDEIVRTPPKKTEHIPTDPVDVKRYIARKVAQRKGTSAEDERSLAEEYGYKRKRKRETRVPVPPIPKTPHTAKGDDDDYDSFRPSEEALNELGHAAVHTGLPEELRSVLNSKRLYAGIWDNIILIAISLAIFRFGSLLMGITLGQLFTFSWHRLILFHLFITALYNIYFTVSNGQTIGKMMFRIRLMSLSGKQVTFLKAVVHFLISLLGVAAAFMGFLWIYFNSNGRSWADIAFDTKIEYYER